MYTQPVQHNKYNKDMLWIHAIIVLMIMTIMFDSIFTMLRCPDSARVTWHREQLQAGAVGTCHMWTLETHEPGIKYILAVSSSIKMSRSVHLTMLQCKHCEQLHFHTSDAVLQFLYNPSKTGDIDYRHRFAIVISELHNHNSEIVM